MATRAARNRRSKPAATSRAWRSRIVTQNKDDERLCRVKVQLPLARQAARELLGAPRDADGRQGPRPRVHSRGRRRGAGRVRARGPALSRTSSARCGTARTSRRSPTTTARTTSASSSRARSTTCCSTTARKGVVELAHEKGRKVTFDDDGIVVKDEKGNSIKIDSNERRDDDRGQGPAQHQGRHDHDRGDRHARVKASATLTRARLAREIN